LKAVLLPAALFLAVAATAGFGVFVVRDLPERAEAPPPAPGDVPEAAHEPPAEARLRPYQTADTLREDLRDALQLPPDALDQEFWRVSRALRSVARATLLRQASSEASPRVRALLVLAAGVHVQDDPALRRFLDDREGLVRGAAALAAGYREDGTAHAALLDAVRVPLGRRDVAWLSGRHGAEADGTARAAMRTVLDAAGLGEAISPPR
jgi:hypothetical protein